MNAWLTFPFALLIRAWQLGPSRILPPTCRYSPSCSEYALQALAKYGLFKGGWLATKRLMRCHPWGGCGHDPVP
ncbi:MAG: membrane protein insertion efficiency factor YidD [Erythrobacter sp.]|jgi:putative membrane protein insertion efficiency factor|nr:membrane protein insertion efficiency factor YidD [Erythrobacter sp.]